MKKFFKYKKFLLLFLFPIDIAFLDNGVTDHGITNPESLSDTADSNETTNNKYKYIFPIFVVAAAFLILYYYYPFTSPPDPYDLSIEYVYPDDGKVRPPQNPKTVALRDYFVIPDKPYFVNGVRNFPLLNKDMLEYINMDQVRPPGRSIPPFIVKWLEICYGYDISQDFFMNLEYHRKLTLPSYGIGNLVPYIPMEFVFNFVKWYYPEGNPYRPLYSIWFTPEELEYMEGKDYYDMRIFSRIYTRAGDWPAL